jgi:2-dehydro-3-deoxyphosphogluconate aldolase/(4S)-4-hydroxy-2-oxoglutarate aldolase
MDAVHGRAEVERTRIIAIVRGVPGEKILPVAEALLAGGIKVMEVTLNTDGALGMIGRLQDRLGDQMFIGAGTVLDPAEAEAAVEAGAGFIVTPNTDTDVIQYCAQRKIPVFPGAMTPTEIVRAWKAGATAVKIFPSASLGMQYLKELQGPLRHIPMVAVGGVNENNIRDFLELGCYALGIGSTLINHAEISRGNFGWITGKAQKLIQAAGS